MVARFVRGNAPALLAATSSLLLSLAATASRHLVNSDGVWYLLAAEAFVAGGLPAARAAHPWPIYGVLIGLIARATGLPAQAAADGLNAVFVATASAFFVEAVRQLGADRRVQWYAAALVLAHRGLNVFRDAIVRDFGGWAFGLVGLVALLRFMRSASPGSAAAWLAAGLIAVAFRPEWALVWTAMALAPLFDTSASPGRRLRRFAMLALPAAAVSVALAGLLLSSPAGAASVWAMAADVTDLGVDAFRGSAQALAASFPFTHGREYAPYLLLFGLAPLPIVKVVLAAGVPVAVLALAGVSSLRERPRPAQAALALSLGAWYVVSYLFALERMFLETRYAVPASLVLALAAPFGVSRLVAASRAPRRRYLLVLCTAWVIATAALALAERRNPDPHVGAAIEWLRQGTPPNARVHTNSPQVAYYCRRAVDWAAVRHAILHGPDPPLGGPYDYWTVLVPANDVSARGRLAEVQGLAHVASFPGTGGSGVEVYQPGGGMINRSTPRP
ncbi:MAG TPA: hypothetical protein VFV66_28340 [Nonomuraea sp.]|nr:hypothetical protein [Nonomuraea sp.]